MRRTLVSTLIVLPGLLAAIACSGCAKAPALAPERAEDPVPTPRQSSLLAVPIDVNTDVVREAVEQAIPRQLWTIDQHSNQCVKPKRVSVFGKSLKVTPAISCTIQGVVTRGAIRLRGSGQDIIADLPIQARISARDVAGLLKGETATGAAMAHARIRLDIDANWNPRGTVRLSYDWTNAPGIDFLGQRVTFTQKADEKLKPVLRKLEQDLPRQLARMRLRQQVERLWARGFTTIALNGEKPPVWMRVTPQQLRFGGYAVQGQKLRLNLGLDAITETFVGDTPANPEPTRLPALARGNADNALHFFLPVVADYRELEPVLLRALQKRSQRPFLVPGVGPVTARFDKVTAYGTADGKIAVGVLLAATPQQVNLGETRGLIWLVAKPVNAENSAKVAFEQLQVTGDTNGVAGNLLVQLVSTPAITEELAGSLTQNFGTDLDKLLGKVRRAVERKQTGDFVIQTKIAQVRTGRIEAHGQGLYLPVEVDGTAVVHYTP